ncbi:hypothetical protein VE01_03243 [Pseudogymnoascus verrucosus]|uniref:Uncharacterized protein n=1 Tax=Pseudogymnoascus verrucosus TaxID=342668 RepID=A0A1B8GSI7_9PEZI|nr:uncharacterized protein VE01_03243 [Pseudogymnoascus verrucosus]OBT98770.1 hypothetical protein VE01_03243 [Pseudogymnoascus verrucosus]
MQDEWEVVAREERILLERRETEINKQPGQQQQMRYSTSNLFEEVPEFFRPMAVSGHMIETVPTSPGEEETNVNEPLLQDASHQERPQNSGEGVASHNKPRQPGYGPRKLAVRKSSPIGSALNPITRRSSSADLRGWSSDSKLPQRSATNPARPNALVSPVTYPSPNFLSYRSKGKGTDGILEMPAGAGTIKEEAKSEDFSPSIRSDVGVKSFALGSIYSSSSLRQERSDTRADESVIVYYGHEDRPQHHRLSDFPRSRPLTPELNGTQMVRLDGVAGGLDSVDEDDGDAEECNCGLNTGEADVGECGDQMHDEELFAPLSTPTTILRRFSITPLEMLHDSCNAQVSNYTSEVTHQDDGVKAPRSLGRAESLIRYLIDIDKFLNIPTEWAKDSSNTPRGQSTDPSNDSFKSIIEVPRGSDIVEEDIVDDRLPKGCTDLFDNVNNDVVGGTLEGANSPAVKDIMAPETAYRLQRGESSATEFTGSTSKTLDSVTDDWIEVSSPETFPTSLGSADLRAAGQPTPDKDLLSSDCDFISAEQHMSDVYHVAHETMDEGHVVVSLAPEIEMDAGNSCSIPDAATSETKTQSDEQTAAESTTQSEEPKAPETATHSDEPATATSRSNAEGEGQTSKASTSQPTDKVENPMGMRKRSKKSRNRRNRKIRAAAETAKAKS